MNPKGEILMYKAHALTDMQVIASFEQAASTVKEAGGAKDFPALSADMVMRLCAIARRAAKPIDFDRRVRVEQRLLDAANGKAPAPTPEECRELANILGVPDEYRGFHSEGSAAIVAERAAHMSREGWTPEHDDEHDEGELAYASACYVFTAAEQARGDATPIDERAPLIYWPWNAEWWKPKDQRRNLVRAGALIAAEIDRLDRKGGRS